MLWYNSGMKRRDIVSSSFWVWAFILLVVILLLSWLFDECIKWTWFPEAIVAWGTLFLGVATFRLVTTTVKENSLERERESKKRRLDEVQHWIEGAAGIRSKYEGPPSEETMFQRWNHLEALLAVKTYVVLEAKRLDLELTTLSNLRNKYEDRLENLIERLCELFVEKHNNVPTIGSASRDAAVDKEIIDKCTKALTMISDLRAELAL
jgi:hypothetical protein